MILRTKAPSSLSLCRRTALPQESIGAVTSFVFSSCDFVDRSFCPENKDDPRSHTNQHELKHSSLELDPTEAKPTQTSLDTDLILQNSITTPADGNIGNI